ncbi:hypothetical protein J14TS2_25200 [Bacillus sp. J14TS2]|uniref:hypothetical protein n=1 Tax=Bacillus sp. J14TS2 TaxID=2807188 RepID=UPI001B2A2ECD|nr:hypothetical protein [Bacillus sp. J14TS2]GIN72045.1 hypothetical protein J14TS2_25200 [Bacillus sp. J14TS2]
MKIQMEFLMRFLAYPVFFLIMVTLLCVIRGNWEDLHKTVGILLAYYILMSIWFYFDLKKWSKKK